MAHLCVRGRAIVRGGLSRAASESAPEAVGRGRKLHGWSLRTRTLKVTLTEHAMILSTRRVVPPDRLIQPGRLTRAGVLQARTVCSVPNALYVTDDWSAMCTARRT